MIDIVLVALLAGFEQGPGLALPNLSAPTKEAAAPTDTEMARLRAGCALFAAKKYDEAIAIFKEMLDANPHSVGRYHAEAFIYHVTQSSGFPGVREWLEAHANEVSAFRAWDRTYEWRGAP